MSPVAYIAIGVGILALLVAVYFAVRSRKADAVAPPSNTDPTSAQYEKDPKSGKK